MGQLLIGICRPKVTGVFPTGVVNTNPANPVQASLGEKMMAIKGIINNDGSRRALLKFLQSRGMEIFLNCYFEIEDMNHTKADDVVAQANLIIDRYKGYPDHDGVRVKPGYESSRENWKRIANKLERNAVKVFQATLPNQTPDIEAVRNVFKSTQDAILSSLAEDMDLFLDSPFYKEWTRSDTKREHDNIARKSFAGQSGSSPTGITEIAKVERVRSTFPSIFKNILIVDDSKIASKIASMALTKLGHSCMIANHGREALDLLRANRFEIILMDLYMPIMNGLETIAKFREIQKSAYLEAAKGNASGKQSSSEVAMPDSSFVDRSSNSVRYSFRSSGASSQPTNNEIITICMSADDDKETVDNALAAGFDHFMVKPFSVENLIAIIDTVLLEDEVRVADAKTANLATQIAFTPQ